jgi:NADH-quinone oxidoreductase subunit I
MINVLDEFTIDFGVCMYCGICVDVCPFDALAWHGAKAGENLAVAARDELVHDKDVLGLAMGDDLPVVDELGGEV